MLQTFNNIVGLIEKGHLKETDPDFSNMVELWERTFNDLGEDANIECFIIRLRQKVQYKKWEGLMSYSNTFDTLDI